MIEDQQDQSYDYRRGAVEARLKFVDTSI